MNSKRKHVLDNITILMLTLIRSLWEVMSEVLDQVWLGTFWLVCYAEVPGTELYTFLNSSAEVKKKILFQRLRQFVSSKQIYSDNMQVHTIQ